MNDGNKQKVKNKLAKDSSWVVIDGILGADIEFLVWNKEVEIIYQDMDSRPCECTAMCVKEPFNNPYFVATNGIARGNRMKDVIAYKVLKEKL